MRNTYIFDDNIIAFETKYSISKDEKIKKFTEKHPMLNDHFAINPDELLFIISTSSEIYEHNISVDFLESNVGNERAFNGCGEMLDEEIYRDIFDIFSNDEGKVMFSSGNYDCKMMTTGEFDSSHYFELKADGLHWREDEEEDEEYEDY